MEYRLIRATLVLIAIVISDKLIAQSTDSSRNQKISISNDAFRTWSVGVSGGISSSYTLIGYNSRQDFMSPDIQLGYAVYLKDQLTNSFGLQADFMSGKLKSEHSNALQPNGRWVYEQSTTKLNWSASLSGNFTIAHWSIVQPYITGGGGVLSYSPTVQPYNPAQAATNLGTLNSFFVPIGFGLKVNVTQDVNFDIGYTVNFVMADDVDGVKYGPTNDRFSYSHIGLEFVLGKRSKKQLAGQLVSVPVQGRILAHDQTLIDTLQEQKIQLAAEREKNTQLKNDLDAANASVAKLTADGDGDGVPDIYDKCPNTPPNTKVDASGCPVPVASATAANSPVADEDKKALAAAASAIEFYSGTEIISGRSFPGLNTVIRMMADKKFVLKIDVYADRNVSTDNDMKLAQLRADAVKNYLVNKGANGSKIQTEGHRGFPADISSLKKRKVANLGLVEFTIVE